MKIVDLFALLKDTNVEKKNVDPIKNVVSAYQKAFNDDDVSKMLIMYEEVHNKFKENFDNNPFTMRNYITAMRDVCRVPQVRAAFLEVADGETGEDDWEQLIGQIDRDRSEHVKAANIAQRVRRKEKSSNGIEIISPIESDGTVIPVEQSKTEDDGKEFSGCVRQNLRQENEDLRAEIKQLRRTLSDCEKKWTIAMQCVLSAMPRNGVSA